MSVYHICVWLLYDDSTFAALHSVFLVKALHLHISFIMTIWRQNQVNYEFPTQCPSLNSACLYPNKLTNFSFIPQPYPHLFNHSVRWSCTYVLHTHTHTHTHTLQFLIHDLILTLHFEAIAVILTSLLISQWSKTSFKFHINIFRVLCHKLA